MNLTLRIGGAAAAVENDPDKSKDLARTIFGEVKAIEEKILISRALAKQIENRSLWGRITASSGKDLADAVRSQNEINEEMLGLIQATIGLNMMSYAGLASLLDELRRCIDHGLVDANGRVITLSSEGRELADTATRILTGILDGAKRTQDSISHNSEQIERIQRDLVERDQTDSRRAELVAHLNDQVVELRERLDAANGALKNANNQNLARIQALESRQARWLIAVSFAVVFALIVVALEMTR